MANKYNTNVIKIPIVTNKDYIAAIKTISQTNKVHEIAYIFHGSYGKLWSDGNKFILSVDPAGRNVRSIGMGLSVAWFRNIKADVISLWSCKSAVPSGNLKSLQAAFSLYNPGAKVTAIWGYTHFNHKTYLFDGTCWSHGLQFYQLTGSWQKDEPIISP